MCGGIVTQSELEVRQGKCCNSSKAEARRGEGQCSSDKFPFVFSLVCTFEAASVLRSVRSAVEGLLEDGTQTSALKQKSSLMVVCCCFLSLLPEPMWCWRWGSESQFVTHKSALGLVLHARRHILLCSGQPLKVHLCVYHKQRPGLCVLTTYYTRVLLPDG